MWATLKLASRQQGQQLVLKLDCSPYTLLVALSPASIVHLARRRCLQTLQVCNALIAGVVCGHPAKSIMTAKFWGAGGGGRGGLGLTAYHWRSFRTLPSTNPEFVQRAQALIRTSFQGISQDFTTPLQACLKAAQQAPPAPPGGYYAPQWPEQGSHGTSSQLGSVLRSGDASSRSYKMRKRARLGQVRWCPNSFDSFFNVLVDTAAA